MEQHGDFPKPEVSVHLGAEKTAPFRTWAQEIRRSFAFRAIPQDTHRGQERRGDWGGLHFQQAQHSRRVTTEPRIAVQHMIERLSSHCGGQSDRSGDERSEPLPTRFRGDDLLQRRAVVLGADQCAAKFGERLQGVAHGVLFVRDFGLAKPLR